MPQQSLRRSYERLRTLEKAAFIQSHREIKGEKFIWTLSKKGFLTIEAQLPPLKQSGFLPLSPGHDLLCSAVLLAETIDEPVTLVTDQELLRSLSDTDSSLHRADGYWKFDDRIIALEVQISNQKTKDYYRVAHFYCDTPDVKIVLWVLSKITMAKGIYAGLSEAKSGIEKHQVISFESFLENGWNAEIEVGSLCGTPIRNILATGNNQIHKAILDTRKSPHTARSPIYYEPGDLWIVGKLK